MSDWIKMRSSLLTNLKVVRMARELLHTPEFIEWMCSGVCAIPRDGVTSRDDTVTKRDIPVVTRIVVGSLLVTWGAVNDTAGRDGIVRHATSRDIDETAGVPGFGKAMVAVGWLEDLPDGSGVRFVNFEEHNQPQKERALTAKTGAERQKEYRERKAREAEEARRRDAKSDANRNAGGDVTGDVTRDGREEERREEKKRKRGSAARLPPCPYDSIVALYHELLPELTGVRVLDDERKDLIRTRWQWVLTTTRPDGSRRAETAEQALEWFREYFERARDNDFVMGRTPRDEKHRNWKPDIEYMMRSSGLKQVLEKTPAEVA